MHDFDFVAATSLDTATRLLKDYKGNARILAGGSDLIVNMRAGRGRPQVVIDAKHIPELNELIIDDKGLAIGAAVSCRRISENSDIAAAYPALIESASLIGGVQIQGRATLGGNLCNAAPSADGIPTLIAYSAIAHIRSVREERQVPMEMICTGPGRTSLADDEILVKITIPRPPANSGAKFLRFTPRNEMDIAVTNAASMVELDESRTLFRDVRIAIGAVAPTPLFVKAAGKALSGKKVNVANIACAAVLAREAASPINDMRGTIEHRRQLTEVLVRRTLQAAVARARGEES